MPTDPADTLAPPPASAFAGLRPWPWSTTLARAALGAFALNWLAGHLLPSVPRAEADAAAWGALLLAVALRWLAGLPDGFTRARRARAWPVRLAIAVVPAELVGMLRLCALYLGACVAWIARRPLPPRPEGRRIEDRRKGFYDAFFALNVVSAVTEVPVMMLLMSSIAHRPWLHAGMHALEFAMLVAMIGDRRLVQAGGHVLTATHLDLRAGARASARVPLAAIAGIETLDKKTRLVDWRRARGVHRAETGIVSVIDGPNCVVTLRPGTAGTWSRLQVERPLPRHLFLYVDDPAALAAALGSRASSD